MLRKRSTLGEVSIGVCNARPWRRQIDGLLIRATDTAMNGAKGYASDQKARAAENAEVLRAV